MAVVVLLLVLFACGFYAGATSGDKGHHSWNWFLGGLFFGPIAVIAAAGLSDHTQRRYLRLLAESQGVELREPRKTEDVANDIIKKNRVIELPPVVPASWDITRR